LKESPVIGANVVIQGTYSGTSTNSDGILPAECPGGEPCFQCIPYGIRNQVREVNAAGETRVDFTLERLAYLAEEVIVSATRAHSKVPVAYTDMNRRKLRAAILGRIYLT
jgi:hypothetical protein